MYCMGKSLRSESGEKQKSDKAKRGQKAGSIADDTQRMRRIRGAQAEGMDQPADNQQRTGGVEPGGPCAVALGDQHQGQGERDPFDEVAVAADGLVQGGIARVADRDLQPGAGG